jgi:hypothetical protein
MDIKNFSDTKPVLDIRKFFNGVVNGCGIVYDFFGRPTLRFTMTLEGQWEGNKGTLVDTFNFTNGLKKERTWQVEVMDDHRYKATAPDVIGEATGEQYGNTAHQRYHLILPRKEGKSVDFHADDWLYLIDERTIINRVKFKKFGITMSELHITFQRK